MRSYIINNRLFSDLKIRTFTILKTRGIQKRVKTTFEPKGKTRIEKELHEIVYVIVTNK